MNSIKRVEAEYTRTESAQSEVSDKPLVDSEKCTSKDAYQTQGKVSNMKGILKIWQSLSVGLYAWIAATFFGAVVLDIVYSGVAARELQASETTAIFSVVADFLLLVTALTILTGMAATASAWRVTGARNLLTASLCLVIVEFLLPVLLLPLLKNAPVHPGNNIGMGFRLIGSASSSILALIGFWKLHL